MATFIYLGEDQVSKTWSCEEDLGRKVCQTG